MRSGEKQKRLHGKSCIKNKNHKIDDVDQRKEILIALDVFS
jgi:hypothetical protein